MAEKAYFLSDLHLGSDKEPNAFLLLQFLKKLKTTDDITHLFLLGDIFDMWLSHHKYYVHKYQAIIDELIRLKKCGVEIHYFEGNHDLFLNDYFAKELGFRVYTEAHDITFLGYKIRLEHGDQMDPDDRGYIFLRWFLRTPLLKWLAPRLPESLVIWIGETSSHKSSQYTRGSNAISLERAQMLVRKHLERLSGHFDMHISGHIHADFDETVQLSQKSIRAINLGSWFNGARVFEISNHNIGFIDLKCPVAL